MPTDPQMRERQLKALASLRRNARRLTHARIEAELRHMVEVARRDDAVEALRAGSVHSDACGAVVSAQDHVDETEAALETARANEATADGVVRELAKEVWS